jgi:hypothetical protein
MGVIFFKKSPMLFSSTKIFYYIVYHIFHCLRLDKLLTFPYHFSSVYRSEPMRNIENLKRCYDSDSVSDFMVLDMVDKFVETGADHFIICEENQDKLVVAAFRNGEFYYYSYEWVIPISNKMCIFAAFTGYFLPVIAVTFILFYVISNCYVLGKSLNKLRCDSDFKGSKD